MFEIWKSKASTVQPYFWTLKGRNGEKLCVSEMYVTKQGAQNGIAAVKSLAPIAQTYDRT